MNMKEIRQVMNNIQYVSLYDYLGRSTKNGKDGIDVSNIAQERGIKPKYHLLPKELQTNDYKSVATWPIDFLDSIYNNNDQQLVRYTQFSTLLDKVTRLENKLNELINVTNSNVGPADDLPF